MSEKKQPESDLQQLPALLDEERLKRFCKASGYDDPPIFDPPDAYPHPTDRLAAT